MIEKYIEIEKKFLFEQQKLSHPWNWTLVFWRSFDNDWLNKMLSLLVFIALSIWFWGNQCNKSIAEVNVLVWWTCWLTVGRPDPSKPWINSNIMQLWPVALEGFRKKVSSLLSLSLVRSLSFTLFHSHTLTLSVTLSLSLSLSHTLYLYLSLSLSQVVGVFREYIIAYDRVSCFYYHSNVLNGWLKETMYKHQRAKG